MESVTSSVEFLSQLRLASTEPGNLTCQHFFPSFHLRILHTSLSTFFVCLPSLFLSTLESEESELTFSIKQSSCENFELKIRMKKEKELG